MRSAPELVLETAADVSHVVSAIAAAEDDDDRRLLWRSLSASSPSASADLAAMTTVLNEALSRWRPDQRRAPLSCFAAIESVAATGPHDPGFDCVRGFHAPPRWPWPICASASFAEQGVTAAMLEALDPAQLAHLQSLTLGVRRGLTQAVAKLIGAAHSATQIHIVGTAISGDAIDVALRSMSQTVTALTLAHINDVAEALRAVLVARPTLTSLTLLSCRLKAVDVAMLTDAGALDRLCQLRLHHVGLNDDAVWRWARQKSPGRLRSLDIEDDAIGADLVSDAFIELIDSGWLSGLETLRVSSHGLSGPRLAHFLSVADLTELQQASFCCSGLDNDDVRALLAAQGRFPQLGVELSDEDIDDALASRLRPPAT